MELFTTSQYNIDGHIKTLEQKRATIHSFCQSIGHLLERITRESEASHVARTLFEMLAFDTQQSIAILEDQKANQAAQLTHQLFRLAEQRDKISQQMDQARAVAEKTLQESTGNKSPQLVGMMLYPLQTQLEIIQAEISRVQAELEKLDGAKA